MKVAPNFSPKLQLDVKLHEWAFGDDVPVIQQYWESVSSSIETLISDILCEQPANIGDFIKDWLAEPKHQALLTPCVAEANQWRVGDSVMARFYGEWYPAKIHRIDALQITVIWDAEWSTSKLDAADIALRESENTVATRAEQPDEHAMKEMRKNVATQMLESPTQSCADVKELIHDSPLSTISGFQECECVLQDHQPKPTWSERLAEAAMRKNVASATCLHVPVWPRTTPSVTPNRTAMEAKPPKSVAVAKSRCTKIEIDSEVQAFITKNDLDEDAADALLKVEPEVQRVVMRRGGLSTAYNPSAALHVRIREAYKCSEMGSPLAERVEAFLKKNPVDDRAADALRSAKAGAQEQAISRGPLTSVVNPSGALMGRLAEAQKKK